MSCANTSNIKRGAGMNNFIPSVNAGLSVFPDGSKHHDDKHFVPQLNNQRIANSNEQQLNINNGCMGIGSDLKRESSQIFLPRTRSFSLDLSNLSSFHDINDTSFLPQTVVFNPTFTQHDLPFTNILSSEQLDDSNTDFEPVRTILDDFTTSVGDEDSNSDSTLFSPRTFLSRPSSISSSSLNESIEEVAKMKRVAKERRRRVKKVKVSHNDIERKYRLSINDKIVQLRDLVPTIRYGFKELSNIPLDQSDIDALDGLEPTKKLSKGTILNKTIEYIKHLEAKCGQYKILNSELTNKLANNNHLASVLPASISSSVSLSGLSSTVPTLSVKTENHLPAIPMQSEFNINTSQNSNTNGSQLMMNNNNSHSSNNISYSDNNNNININIKQEKSFSPLTKVFIENDAGNGDNNLFKFESLT